jgi:SAM-dependent methyltransferase
VTAFDILEHLDDDQRGLSELERILKPGGTLVLFVPALQFLWSLQDEVGHHYRRYSAKELGQKLRIAGFEIIKLSYANSLLFPLIWGGRIVLRLIRGKMDLDLRSEADLSPDWSNGILEKIFSTERTLLRWINFPIGVSILCTCRKSRMDYPSY